MREVDAGETPLIQALDQSYNAFIRINIPRGGFNKETRQAHLGNQHEFSLNLVRVMREGTEEEAARAVDVLLDVIRTLAFDQGMAAVGQGNGRYAR